MSTTKGLSTRVLGVMRRTAEVARQNSLRSGIASVSATAAVMSAALGMLRAQERDLLAAEAALRAAGAAVPVREEHAPGIDQLEGQLADLQTVLNTMRETLTRATAG